MDLRKNNTYILVTLLIFLVYLNQEYILEDYDLNLILLNFLYNCNNNESKIL